MRILVIDQCSGAKEYPDESPVFGPEEIDSNPTSDLLEKDGVAAKKARNLYTGRQQRYIDEAVDGLRAAGHHVDRYFISAGFGLVEESEALPPYEVTFNDMSDQEVRARADRLEIGDSIRDLVSFEPSYDVVFFAVGSKYYVSVNLERTLPTVPSETFVVLFNQEAIEEEYENVLSISARTEDAKENGSIVVALKGTYLKNFTEYVTAGATVKDLEDIRDYCTTEYTTQAGFDRYE